MARTRPNPPVIHMIVAILVVLVPALLLVAWFQRVPPAAAKVVDPGPVIAAAADASPYDLAVPRNLPADWVCTRARWTPVGQPGMGGAAVPGNTFALGYLTPAQIYVAVDQRDAALDPFVADVTRSGSADGTSTVDGRPWTRYVSRDGRTRSLVLSDNRVATIVSADLDYEPLEAFAGTLTFTRKP